MKEQVNEIHDWLESLLVMKKLTNENVSFSLQRNYKRANGHITLMRHANRWRRWRNKKGLHKISFIEIILHDKGLSLEIYTNSSYSQKDMILSNNLLLDVSIYDQSSIISIDDFSRSNLFRFKFKNSEDLKQFIMKHEELMDFEYNG